MTLQWHKGFSSDVCLICFRLGNICEKTSLKSSYYNISFLKLSFDLKKTAIPFLRSCRIVDFKGGGYLSFFFFDTFPDWLDQSAGQPTAAKESPNNNSVFAIYATIKEKRGVVVFLLFLVFSWAS